ncbi:MAG: 4-hydroxy-tetrahydrodipicolinate reductase [Magnetospirillum sp. WYHS-4]
MKIGIVGCAGRMGRMLVQAVLETPGAGLAGGSEREGSPFLGQDVAVLAGDKPCGLTVTEDPEALFRLSDAVIDFTLPGATVAHALLAARHKTCLVLGTTGLGVLEQEAVATAALAVPVVQAANFSVGVNLLLGLTRQVAAMLGEDFDIEVAEMHHRHKVDAPSGTALALGRAAAEGRGVALETVWQKVRDGHTGERKPGDIGFATLRGGDVVGEHTVLFAGSAERVELTHKAGSRAIFARGAVRAALWCADRHPGHYSMQDVLGL